MTDSVRIRYGDHASHFADLRLPAGPGPHPIVIVIHGGFWRVRYGLEETEGLACALARFGCATWNIEYRRIGETGGGWPGTLEDVARAADHVVSLREVWPIDVRRVIALGHSAGGHLALWLAARGKLAGVGGTDNCLVTKIAGVVSLAGVCDLFRMAGLNHDDNPVVAFMGGTPVEVRERYVAASPDRHLPLLVPQMLLHGIDDDRVPLAISEDYAKRAKEAGDEVTFLKLPNVGHFEFLRVGSEACVRSVQAVVQLMSSLRGQGIPTI